ncbi:MAG: PGF-pre-PGF domain-containing protein [Methanoregula sp.]|jgi:hypothetical protein
MDWTTRRFLPGIAYGLLIIVLLALAGPVSAVPVLTIDNSSANAIASNLSNVDDGGTLILNPGTYFENGLTIPANITIRANTSYSGTASNTIIDAESLGRIFYNNNKKSLTIDNLTLQNGNAAGNAGGAIRTDAGSVTILSSTIRDCAAVDGGAISSSWGAAGTGATITIISSTITGCSASQYGGAVFGDWGGDVITITSSTISDCTASAGGAVYFGGGTQIITGSTLTSCSATSGGAIYNGGTITITSSEFTCLATLGGAIFNSGTITITSSTFSSCLADLGGAIYNSGTISITTSTFSSCSATIPGGYGGAIYNGDTISITSSTFSSCLADLGGAIYNGGTITITSSTFTSCSAFEGGAIYQNAGDTTVHYSRIYDCNTGTAIVRNAGSFSATNTWWGTNADPSGFTSGGVTTTPWLMLGATASPSSIASSQTSLIRANLTFDSAGTNTIASGHVPNGTEVMFVIVSGPGSLSTLGNITTLGVTETTLTPTSTGTVNVSATVNGQTVYVEVPVSWPAPMVTAITPDAGMNISAISITNLAGSGLLAGAEVRLVRAGHANITATDVTVASPAQITCTLPITGAEAGAWDVVVTNPDGQEAVLPGGFTVTPAAPTVTGITPNNGLNVSIVSITNLAGSGFQTGAAVVLMRAGYANITATSVVTAGSTRITCILPITHSGTGAWDVVVTNPDGQEGVLPGGFTVTTPGSPAMSQTLTPQGTGETLSDFPSSPTNPLMTVTVNIGGDSKAWQAIVTGTKLSDLIVTGTEQQGAGYNVTAPPGVIFQYISFVPARYDSITKAVINFTVPQAWLDEHHIAPGSIVLYHQTANGWEALPTTVLYSKDGTVYFSAESAGFSLFTIAGTPATAAPAVAGTTSQGIMSEVAQPPARAAIVKAPATTQTTAPPANPAKTSAPSSLLNIVLVIAAIGILAGGGFMIRRWWIRRQNPGLFEEYD